MISWFCCIFKRKWVKIGKKTSSFDFIISTAVEELPLRVGRTEGFRRHPSASTGFAVEFSLAIYFIIAPVNRLSRAVYA